MGVSDGLLAELRRKMDDDTPRGITWPMKAQIVTICAPFAQTEEEIEMVNAAIVAMLQDADEKAFDLIVMGDCVERLKQWLADRAG